jgi:hypothetical protein
MLNPRRIKDAGRKARNRLEVVQLKQEIYDEKALEWFVAEHGYEWRDVKGRTEGGLDFEGRVLAPILVDYDDDDPAAKRNYRIYHPLCHQGLFFDFAQCAPTEESVLSFATRFGFLCTYDVSFTTPELQGIYHNGEQLILWDWMISDMRQAIAFWKAVQTQDEKAAKELMTWDDTLGWTYMTYDSTGRRHVNRLVPDGKLVRLPKDKALDAARGFTQCIINGHLDSHCGAFIAKSEVSQCYIPRIRPTSLLGCIWWQFARTFTGEIAYKFCKICGSPIEVSKLAEGGHYSNREFCSGSCRQKDHRNKVSEARRLADSGKKPAAIAKAMGIELETIERWLTKRK